MGSDNSGRGARLGRYTTGSSDSYHSNPFAGSDVGDNVQLQDFSYIEPRITQSQNSGPRDFVSERPSRVHHGASTNLRAHKLGDSLREDHAASEWETVAVDDENESRREGTPKPLRRQANFKLTFRPDETLHPNLSNWGQQTRSFEPVPPRELIPQQSVRLVPASSPRLRSFHSSSSVYSTGDNNGESAYPERLRFGEQSLAAHSQEQRAAVVQGDNDSQKTIKRLSQASGSSDGNNFKFDSEKYSSFLNPTAERDVSDALHHAGVTSLSKESMPRSGKNKMARVPVQRKEEKRRARPEPVSDLRLTGDIATLLKTRDQTGTEADWQTVTTEHPFGSMQQEFHDSYAKGTGSSLADVSDTTEHRQLGPFDYGSTDKIIQHPQRHDDTEFGPFRVRTDKQTNASVSLPQQKGRPGFFPQNAAHYLKPPPRQPGFADIFRKEGLGQGPNPMSGTAARNGSYQTLGSDPDPHGSHPAAGPSNENKHFRWSRIRDNLGRSPPKTPLTIFDQPLYRSGIKEPDGVQNPPHVPHDEFLSKIPKLPFPLISLPEAAMLQFFKRERGEEDHTDDAHAFLKRSSATGTANTSFGPQTPSPNEPNFASGSGDQSLPLPIPARHPQRANQVQRRSNSQDTVTGRFFESLASPSAILDSPPATHPRSDNVRGGRSGLPEDFTTFYDGLPRLNGFSASTRNRRAGHGRAAYGPADGSLFTQSETELIGATRQEILFRRSQSDVEDIRERNIFMGIMILTFLFPFIGLLALWGKFDSAISWLTHGEKHRLTKDQRGTLKQQLLVEAVIYPVLIITLSVYYSTHH
ncbi:hypothetical protein FALBO_13825 [Fusarium albosuccineum]|uniref:Uncharacterized protein n=1 Tax=Fusarium albosuccineum TaxID=1237068 RepID=A0A8H4L1J1_9HYPO|nr:hypothetical protein FALBO_13825 [Fusarium albosuccineum]